MTKEEKFSISEKISVLTKKEEFKNPKVSPEGYGSFNSKEIIPSNSTIPGMADGLLSSQQINITQGNEEIDKRLERIFSELKMFETGEIKDPKIIATHLRPLVKQAESIQIMANNLTVNKYKEAIDFTIYNLKMNRLFNESRIEIKDNSYEIWCVYLSHELQSLYKIVKGTKDKQIMVVCLESLRKEIIQRLK